MTIYFDVFLELKIQRGNFIQKEMKFKDDMVMNIQERKQEICYREYNTHVCIALESEFYEINFPFLVEDIVHSMYYFLLLDRAKRKIPYRLLVFLRRTIKQLHCIPWSLEAENKQLETINEDAPAFFGSQNV